MLRSPGGIGTDSIALIDGLNDLGGTAITNMVIDDDVANTAANDMVQATTAAAPYTKSWRPVSNSSWMTLVDPSGRLGTPKITFVEEVDVSKVDALYAVSAAYSPQN